MSTHITVLGVLYIVFNALGVLLAGLVLLVTMGAGLAMMNTGPGMLISLGGTVGAVFLATTSIPGFIGGIGLLNRQRWARILVIVLGVLQLVNLPFGTAVGVYTLCVLLGRGADREFARY